MKKVSFGILIGLILGVLAVYSMNEDRDDEKLIQEIGDVRIFETIEVEQHRDNQFSDLNSIEAIQSLPGDFTRAEALHALSSRSSGEELVRLAVDANRLTDALWREEALDIVFRRLTETTPVAALELARSEAFRADRRNQATVLQTWARDDLASAVSAISLFDDRERSLSAQMIYSGVGGAYTVEAQMVEDALGIAPSRSNRERFVRGLAEVSPQAALDHVLGLSSAPHQHEQVHTVAKLASYRDIAFAEQLADQIDDRELQRRYLGIVFDELARTEPMVAATKRFAIRGEGSLTSDEKKAFKVIVEDDIDDALTIFARQGSAETLVELGAIIAAEYAKQDSRSALDWAKSVPESARQSILKAVIEESVEYDPAFALQAADELTDRRERYQLITTVVTQVAEKSPQSASELLEFVEDQSYRINAARQIAVKWFESDAFVALDWALGADPEVQQAIFKDPRVLASANLYDAQSIVGSLPPEHRALWSRSVAERLITEESPEHAIQFVNQFSGQPDYDMQMAHVIAKLGRKDSELAMQWITRVESGHARDGALATMVDRQARDNPDSAIDMLQLIDDPDVRHTSAASVAQRWLRKDRESAERWLDSLPDAGERDSILMNASMQMYGDDELRNDVIQNINDPEKRAQALVMDAMIYARDDPEEMIQRLDTIDMPEIFKQQIKAQIIKRSIEGR